MKKGLQILSLWSLVWLFCEGQGKAQITASATTTYSSPNAITNTSLSYKDVLKLDFLHVYMLTTDVSGGVIGSVSPGGEIKLQVYSYDESKPDGKGPLVYGVSQTSSTTTYAGNPWFLTVDLGSRNNPTWAATAKSNDIRVLCQEAQVFFPSSVINAGNCKSWSNNYTNWNLAINSLALENSGSFATPVPSECKDYYYEAQPVVVEATLTNATLNMVRIPGMGEFHAGELFDAGAPIAAINRKITLASHRGNWQAVGSPENTKNALRDMFTAGYDMVELDLWSTLDDQLIVFHDMGLNKRTTQTGSVRARSWNSIKGLPIKNRFDEVIDSTGTRLVLLSDVLDYIRQMDPNGKVLINLDRSANDVNFFKQVYQMIDDKDMLDRAIFKGRFNPAPDNNGEIAPTASTIRQAFTDMFPGLSQAEKDNRMRMMHFTPVLFDNAQDQYTTNDQTFALRVKGYVDSMIAAGIADGFELNFKSYPVGSAAFANSNDNDVFLLRQWPVLGDEHTPTRNFVQYVHSKGLPVGIFASVPEVCAIPDFKADGTRDPATLVSGFVKEDLNNNYNPKVKDQSIYDFRGDWDFYIPAGVDYVITDRPDALREYLKAIGRSN